MAKRIKDTDYLVVSARIKAMEAGLLSREMMDRVLEARTDDEADRLLKEYGYPALDAAHPERMDAALNTARTALLEDLSKDVPDHRYIDIFNLKYDYHNVKAILKAKAMGVDADHMLTDMGRVPAEELKAALSGEEEAKPLPSMLAQAAAEASQVLSTTRDPQLADITLDQWSYREMTELARSARSSFLRGYVRIQLDAANLRTLVRTLRMGKSREFLQDVLAEGGDVPPAALLSAAETGGSGLAALYDFTILEEAAKAGEKALSGGPMTAFEKCCDDAVSAYLAQFQFVPFGEEPLVNYLAARETEYTNLRILMVGRVTGLPHDVVRSRLRESCIV